MPKFDATTPRVPVVPRIAEGLTPRELSAVWFEDEDRFEGVELIGAANAGEIRARNVMIEDARITGSLGGAKLRDLHLHDTVIDGADLANVDLSDAHLNRLTITDTRLTGADLTKATLQDVVLTGCRLDFAILAATRIDRVIFRDCVITEATLEQAQLRDVRFDSCDLTRSSLGQSQHTRVEMHGCRLAEIRSLHDLRGVAMPYPDLVDQAVNLAGALGIRVATDPNAED